MSAASVLWRVLWRVLPADQDNSMVGMEWGAKVMWHELMHHLGLSHTFGANNGGLAPDCTSNSDKYDDLIDDTPRVAGEPHH